MEKSALVKLMFSHLKPLQVPYTFYVRRRSLRRASNYVLDSRNLTLAVCFVFLTLTSSHAQTPDINKIWTTIGSGGTLDETSVGKVFFERGVVQMGRLAVGPSPTGRRRVGILQQTQSAVIRYNVTPVHGLFTLKPQPCTGACSAYKLTLRYLAGGINARVVANLIEVDLTTGAESGARLTFDSINFGAANHYQVQDGKLSCGPAFSFDFKRKAYYVEATLTTSSIIGDSAAGIQIIKIETDVCR